MSSNTFKSIGILLAIITAIWLASKSNIRLDLTEEQRYTLTDNTKNIARQLTKDVFVKVYLTGSNLPGGFTRLEQTINQTLTDLKANNPKINFKFVDIYNDITNEKERNELIGNLASKGLNPTNVYDSQNGKKTQSLIIPGALVQSDSLEIPILLLKGSKLATPAETLNQSCENVEFEFASALNQINQKTKKKIGFFVNQSSLPAIKQIELIKLLKNEYELFPVDLKASATLDGLDAIFVHKPDKNFNDSDLFKIDQFIMKGGAALFFIDAVKIDTLSAEGSFASPIVTGLEPLLYKYGVRINNNLVKDYQMSSAIPLAVGNMGNKANIQLVPWPYFPLISNFGNSPIVNNLDAIFGQYSSSIDTVKVQNVKKTALLLSSFYTQTINAPAAISYNMASKDFDPNKNSEGVKTFAYILEGNFPSMYAGQIIPNDTAKIITKSNYTKIIVCSDADIAMNDFDKKTKAILPLGFDKYSQNTYANKDFVKNAVDYLLQPNGAILSRNKSIKLRPIDKIEISENSKFWQAFNLLVPLFAISFLGLLYYFYQRKRYL